MKLSKVILISIIASVISIVLLFSRGDLGNNDLVKNAAYFFVPVILTLGILLVARDFKLLFKNLSIALGIYWLLLTISELFIYKAWVSYLTPAGQAYSRYELSSLYPQVGLIMMILLFLAALIMFVLYQFIVALIKVKLFQKPKAQNS